VTVGVHAETYHALPANGSLGMKVALNLLG